MILLQLEEKREYNKIMQRIHRAEDKKLGILYQEYSISGITFSDFKQQVKMTRLQRLSFILSDEELKLSKLSFKLSDDQIIKTLKKKKEISE